jgi:hypothetical protein
MANSSRQDQTFTVTTNEKGKVIVRTLSAINVDDVLVHLVNEELFRLITGVDPGETVPQDWVDDLVNTNYTAG